MRRWLSILLVAPLLLTQCGGEEDITDLAVQITQHPVGGHNITHIQCAFQAKLIGGDEPIVATVSWIWENTVIWSDQWTFTDTDWESVTATYDAQVGYVLTGEFWLRINWHDSDGDPGSITSSHCICTAGEESSGTWETPR